MLFRPVRGCRIAHAPTGAAGATGPTGSFQSSFLFVWTTEEQTLPPTNGEGTAIAFANSEAAGTALSFTGPTDIGVLESGYYYISWDVYKTGYDSAFALFYDGAGGSGMVPGSNHGAMAHDEKYHGQAVSFLMAGGVLTLNRIDSLYYQSILNEIGDRTLVVGASVVVMKIG